ncbi:hypothetical protein PISMIDRAFT_546516 [Pisolithus microcarpus 441]|uniref:Uncharacterized protein n=1 Tax=Pisolithus microcarpus 441 TaxID=765257 RepID=A0A0C9Y969_9AGAM|nr:hypothetical protein PISMIDRAFT_546516 [Pisolithus microcarpus 441]
MLIRLEVFHGHLSHRPRSNIAYCVWHQPAVSRNLAALLHPIPSYNICESVRGPDGT